MMTPRLMNLTGARYTRGADEMCDGINCENASTFYMTSVVPTVSHLARLRVYA